MKLITRTLTTSLALSFLLFGSITFGQSNTPCGGAGAPSISVNASCVNSTVNINAGATYQSNAANFGAVTCGSSGADVWYSFTAPATGSVLLQTGSGSITDACMALYESDCTSNTLINCDDDGGVGTMPEITAGNLTPGQTYYVRLWQYGGGTGNFTICITEQAALPPAPTNITCDVPDPICSGSPIVFTAQSNGTSASSSNPGNDYDCLSTSPNPSWYYLEIATGGNLGIDITAGSDVDFELWGPFANLAVAVANCDSYGVPVDCSYSTAAVEQANAAGVLPGEVYVLLVTNYANTVQTITLDNTTASTATTNCNIVLPIELGSFTAIQTDEGIQLDWITLSENDNDYFVVERSNEGSIWTSIGFVDGAGTSSDTRLYDLMDRKANTGTNYYRLKLFNLNGSVKVYDAITVQKEASNDLLLIPNPANGKVLVTSQNEFSEVIIRDISGTIILTKNQSWLTQSTVDIAEIQAGIYIVSIQTKSGLVSERLVIK